MRSLPHKVTYALYQSEPFTVSQQQCRQQASAQLDFSAIFLTSTPLAAAPVRPAFQTSFGAADAASGPHQPEQRCIFVEAVRGAQLRTWLAGFSLCVLGIAGYWPLPAEDPAHAEKKKSTQLEKTQTEKASKRKPFCITKKGKLPLVINTQNVLYLNICACVCVKRHFHLFMKKGNKL